MATPLKINNVGGDEIKEFTTAEENYIAYQIGLHLAAGDSSDEAALNKLSGGDSVGNYVNNFFNEPVGTHPSTSITSGSTTTTIYQGNGTAAETDSDVKIPIRWVDIGGQTGFKQMPDSDLNSSVDRYLSTIFTNDYPGVFKLASSSPGVDYSVHISNAFTDTRTDGTSVVYNIYRRDSYSAPTTVRPLFVRDNAGFDGIQAMNDRQIKYSFGQRAKTRITASKIGTYQLRTATQGAPTDPGTWVSAGTATDTKQTTSEQSFTSLFTAYYATDYTRAYTAAYTGNYINAYASAYTNFFESVAYTRAYTASYTNTYTGAYNKAYTRNFQLGYTRNFQTDYVRQQAETYIGSYQGTYNRTTYTGPVYNLDRTYQRNYTRNINYVGPGLTGYARGFNTGYIRNFAVLVNYTRNVTVFFDAANFDAIEGQRYLGLDSYVGPPNITNLSWFGITRFGQHYIGPPSAGRISLSGAGYAREQFVAPGAAPNVPQTYSRVGPETATFGSYNKYFGKGYFGGAPTGPVGAYVRTYSGPPGQFITFQYINANLLLQPYVRNTFLGGPTGTRSYRGPNQFFGPATFYNGPGQMFQGPMRFATTIYLSSGGTSPALPASGGGTPVGIGGAATEISGPFYTGNDFYPVNPISGLDGTGRVLAGVNSSIPNTYVRGPYYTLSYDGAQTLYYQRNLTYQRNYTRAYTRNYTGIDGAYTRNYNIVPQYVRNFALNVNYTPNYEGNVNFEGAIYERNFVGNYTSNYIRDYTSNYIRDYTRVFSGLYSRAFNTPYVTDYISSYTGTYTTVFSGEYSTDYIIDYITDYSNAYESEYATVYTGNFEGLTIDATSETIETYTLYVRIG